MYLQQREYQLAGVAPRNHYIAKIKEQGGEEDQNDKIKEKDGDEEENLKEKQEQNEKFRYSLQERPDDASVANEVVEFVPVDFPSRVREGDTLKPAKEAIAEKTANASEGRRTDAAPSAQLAINSRGNSGRINKLNFSPIDLLGRAGGENKPGVVQQILSNAIPALDLLPAGDVFSNSTDKFISFVPVEVTRRKVKGGAPRQKLKSKKKGKEEELMKLLMTVENMNAAETRATIIAKNREKRRRRKERREREKLKMEKMRREKLRMEREKKMKENSVLPPDGYHASNSQKNFLKKKYYSRWVTQGQQDCKYCREAQKLNPLPLPEEKKNSLYSQILASYR